MWVERYTGCRENDAKEDLPVLPSPFKYTSAQRHGSKSADVTLTENCHPSAPPSCYTRTLTGMDFTIAMYV
jgi:hypothetical protein